MKRVMGTTTSYPTFAFVPLSVLIRLEHMEPDVFPMCERNGVFATRLNVPENQDGREATGFFVIKFYQWRSKSIKPI